MLRLLDLIFQLYILAVVIRAVISWFSIDLNNPFIKFLHDITEPILSKIRNIVPLVGGMDLSPLVLIIVLSILRRIIIY